MQIQLQEAPAVEEQHTQEALKQAMSWPFDMATGPMIHATLIPIRQQGGGAATSEDENILLISTHYSVADGWSMGVLFRDLSRAYNMLKLGEGRVSGFRIKVYSVGKAHCQTEMPSAAHW